MMLFFPVLMYYFWICLWFYDGQLTHPASFDDIGPFVVRMWEHIRDVSTTQPHIISSDRLSGCRPDMVYSHHLLRSHCIRAIARFYYAWI